MGRYRFGEQLGSGGFGVVKEAALLAEDEVTVVDDALAVKFLADFRLDDPEAVERFQREVAYQAELGHPNVMPVLDAELAETPPWFVMPRAATNLKTEIDGGRAGDRAWAIHVFRQVLEGLAHAHERGVLHRDIKPENVLFCGGVPKIADFGLGKSLESEATTLTKSAAFLGTERYMAPEQFTDAKNVGPPADVYAAGKVFLQMLTGQLPDVFHADVASAPRDFHYFVDKSCRHRADERFADAGEMLAAFKQATAAPEFTGPPMEGAAELVDAWGDAQSDEERLGIVRQLDEHLMRHADDQDLFRKVFPRLPPALVAMYTDGLTGAFANTLSVFDGHVSAGLPFEYCDVVADFYADIFRRTDDLALQRTVLARLIDMGASHNRWHVGNVVADLLAGIDDVSTSMLAAEVIEADDYRSEWYWEPFCKSKHLPRPVADAFAKVTAT